MGLLSNLFRVRPEEKKRFPPVPQWQPNTPIDIDRILKTARYYTDDKLQLGIFKYGTVAFFSTRIDDIEEGSKICLDKIYNFHADFKPLTMDDGNYLIEYSQPAFTIVFNDELENHWDYIEKNHQQGVCTDEAILNARGQANVFDRIGKICLFGRAKMFMDAQDPEIVKPFDPV
ncbi:hypothetical protein [Mucilaginibacter lappiensis]|uniref:hypothetical protein n=1 Tax=Mucilaginibacter lappiensis TaxID=354630 RepID=UPI003D1BC539